MHALVWPVVRALTKLGIAIVANSAMMPTTIIISTNVKPDRWFALTCIFFGFLNSTNKLVYVDNPLLLRNCIFDNFKGFRRKYAIGKDLRLILVGLEERATFGGGQEFLAKKPRAISAHFLGNCRGGFFGSLLTPSTSSPILRINRLRSGLG